MEIDYHDSERARELAARARAFVDEVVIPTEREHLGDGPVPASVVDDLRAEARDRGVYCPGIDPAHGGMGESFRDVLPLFEQAGRSLLGPPAMRVAAPDEGNMHTLELVGTDAQKRAYLDPLVAGEISSGFSMTEPAPGAGSDPKMLRTTARKDGDEWVIDGHKWWTTGGDEADVLIVMARTDPEAHPYAGCSLFLVPGDAPGVEVVESIPHLGQSLVPESHAEIRYDGVRVPESALLGERDEGFTHAQERLGPARLTHCMRYSGMAMRALEIARAYMSEREAFGSALSDKQAGRHAIADAETSLHATRSMVRHAAAELAAGERARVEVSMSKLHAARTAGEAIDLAVQCCGGAGVSRHLPLADFYESVRAFRIVDGADEVHKRVIARAAFEGEARTDELANLPTFGG